MKNLSVKKVIKYIIIAALLVGFVLTNFNLIKLIDIVITTPINNILFFIFNLVGDFGLSIIIFTILVKLCLWPLSKSQIYQTRLMNKIQPELAKIRKNCNGNKQMESLQTMDLYKRYNVKPFHSLLVILIQFPIFIALYLSIKVMVMPNLNDNLSTRAYSFIQIEGSEISDVIKLQEPYLSDLANDNIPKEEKSTYDFEPKLLNLIPLDNNASAIFSGNVSSGAIFALVCSLAAALTQYFVTKQQQPSGKSEKSKKFRDLIKEAEDGKEPDQSEIAAMTTGSMSKMMPIMMFIIMIGLPGALVFYYLLSNLFLLFQQKVLFKMAFRKMDDMTDATVSKELKQIQEAQIIENKKTGTKIKHISLKDNKKKRR